MILGQRRSGPSSKRQLVYSFTRERRLNPQIRMTLRTMYNKMSSCPREDAQSISEEFDVEGSKLVEGLCRTKEELEIQEIIR